MAIAASTSLCELCCSTAELRLETKTATDSESRSGLRLRVYNEVRCAAANLNQTDGVPMDLATRPAIDSITSLAEVNRLLHDTLVRERTLESKVEALYQGRDAHISSFDRLNAETAEVGT